MHFIVLMSVPFMRTSGLVKVSSCSRSSSVPSFAEGAVQALKSRAIMQARRERCIAILRADGARAKALQELGHYHQPRRLAQSARGEAGCSFPRGAGRHKMASEAGP